MPFLIVIPILPAQGIIVRIIVQGDTKILGGEFIGAVVDARFFGGSPHILVRRALLAANLVSNKVTDGIARLLQKTDVAALTRREMASKITALETAMKEVSKCAVSLVLQEAIGEVDVRDACWRFDIRCVLHVCKKGKASFENRQFADLAAIKKEFLMECADMLKKDVNFMDVLPESWASVVPKSKAVVVPTEEHEHGAEKADPIGPLGRGAEGGRFLRGGSGLREGGGVA